MENITKHTRKLQLNYKSQSILKLKLSQLNLKLITKSNSSKYFMPVAEPF